MVERLSSLLQSLKPKKSPDKDVTRLESDKGSNGIRAQDKPLSPVSAEESLRWLHAEPGYRVRLVAAEPQVVDPVAMQIDEEHRMWVVEMRDYPMGDPEQGLGRVVVLQDEDRDGRYERATTFASGLRFPTGIQLWKGGAFVTAAGELLYLKDENRDLIADSQETVLKGFSIGNPQLRANHPTIGMDGWLYVANGLKGGKVELPSSQPTSEAIDMTNRDLRLNLKEGRVEAITGPSQFGLSMDAWGHRYGCSNRRPCIEMMVEQSDISRSPLAGLVPPIIDSLPAEAQSSVRPLVDAWTTSNLHAGQFTAACGVLVSHSRHLPSSAYGHAFACEPTGSLVQRRAVQRPRGQTLVADESPQREWLASEDPWFRPVNLIEGPQGAIYVADMYRAVIEHPEWVPEELKKRPDERFGEQQGRIYCVERSEPSEPADAKSKEPVWSIATSDDLVSALESPDAWCRQTASRRLLEKEDATAIPLLSRLAIKSHSPLARIHAAHLLGYWQKLDPVAAMHLVQDPDPRVRGTAWRLLPQGMNLSGSDVDAAALKSLTSADVDEVRSVCWYLAKLSPESMMGWESEVVRTCAQRAAKDPGDGYSLMAYSAACSRQLGLFLTEWTRELEEGLGRQVLGSAVRDELLPEIALQAMTRLAQRLEEKEQLALRQQIHRYSQQDVESLRSGDRLASLQRAMGLSLLEGFCLSDKRRVGVSSASELQWIIALSGPSHSDASARVHALRLLRYLPTEEAVPILLKTFEHGSVSECRAALSAASYHRNSEIDQWLLKNFAGGAPDLRVETFGAIRNVSERLEELIHRLETNQIPLRSLDASMRQQLQSSGNAQQKKRIQSILAKANDPNREKVIQEYAQRLEKKGDLAQGRALFGKNCGPCHRVHDQGFAVGPDISDTRTQSYEKLLVSILDPNRSIDASFLRYVALMEDGEIVDGLLRDSNSETITLRGQNGRDTTIAKNLISELKSTGVSMMPEGIEQQITVEQMSDLLYYLKNWRYPLSNVPAEAIAK